MVSERWLTSFDMVQLREHLTQVVFSRPITWQSKSFGGWSVLAFDGSIQDGWQKGHYLFDSSKNSSLSEEFQKAVQRDFTLFTKETEICTGYLRTMIEVIRDAGLEPYRARIICLPSGSSSVWHSDGTPEQYAVRLHIPIITNPDCFFETETDREHLQADGSSYFIQVNRPHRVINGGATDRFHLVMNVKDKLGISKFHQFSSANR